ncbi:MAG: hypothetical protein ACM3PP_11230 [Candidatus Saccharibacteria bacterium]
MLNRRLIIKATAYLLIVSAGLKKAQSSGSMLCGGKEVTGLNPGKHE